MARQPKPWYRSDRKVWCVTINGKRHNLGRDKKDAMRRFYAMMRDPARRAVLSTEALPIAIDAFLDWTHRNRAAETYRWYRDHLQSFAAAHPRLEIGRLKPYHVETWAANGCNNVNTRRNRMRAVKRCMRWATGQGYIEQNPIVGLEIPAAQPRDVFVSPGEFAELLGFVRDPRFAELLRVTYETGCRPQESLRVEARHLDLRNQRWVFPRAEAKGKAMPRAVYLTEHAVEVSRRLAKHSRTGPLFRNSHGGVWNAFSISCAFDRVQQRMGLIEMRRSGEEISQRSIAEIARELSPTRTVRGKRIVKTESERLAEARRKLVDRRAKQLAPRYSLYALRHSWATNALRAGVDALTVAVLMGHKDPSTLARTYQHLGHDPAHLLSQAQRASRCGGDCE